MPSDFDMNAGLCGALPRREHPTFAGYGSVPSLRKFEDVMPDLIPPSKWSERLKELTARKMLVSDHVDFEQYSQASTNFCWTNGPCQSANVAQRIANIPYVQFSSASVACKVNGFVNQGGWGIDAVKYLSETGACSVDLWPNTAIDRRYDNAESMADRANHQVLEWIDVPCDNFDALATCLLQPWACVGGFDFWRHEVSVCDLVEVSPGKFGIRIRNSWFPWGGTNSRGVDGFAILTGSERQPDDCQCVRVATASNV